MAAHSLALIPDLIGDPNHPFFGIFILHNAGYKPE
jgi:hypothetical protein